MAGEGTELTPEDLSRCSELSQWLEKQDWHHFTTPHFLSKKVLEEKASDIMSLDLWSMVYKMGNL